MRRTGCSGAPGATRERTVIASGIGLPTSSGSAIVAVSPPVSSRAAAHTRWSTVSRSSDSLMERVSSATTSASRRRSSSSRSAPLRSVTSRQTPSMRRSAPSPTSWPRPSTQRTLPLGSTMRYSTR